MITFISKGYVNTSGNLSITSIPQDGTDLLFCMNVRIDSNTANANLYLRFNNDTSSIYSSQVLRGNPAVGSAESLFQSDISDPRSGELPGTSSSSTSFGMFTLYIPNYTSSILKRTMLESTSQRNDSNAPMNLITQAYNSSNPISSIQIIPQTTPMVAYWSLYKITKA